MPALLLRIAEAAQAARALQKRGARMVVIKLGENGALLCEQDGSTKHVPAYKVDPVDTTAAGDSFNGGYLAAILRGAEPPDCLAAGHAMARHVVGHPGAIVPEPE